MDKTPTLTNYEETKSKFSFTITDINVSFINSLRRTIISDIPTFVFKTFPHNESNVTIHKNNGRLNNEIIKQRISCIPIHIKDHSIDYNNFEFIINKTNDQNEIIYVTTNDFQVKNTLTNKFLPKNEVQKIFPADSITGDYIVISRLRPKMGDTIPGETLHLTGKISLETAKTDGAFNVSHTCFYRNSVNPIKQNEEWSKYEKTLSSLTSEEKELEKKNWYLHEGLRFFKNDTFDFEIESIGVFKNKELLKMACNILIDRLKNTLKNIQNNKNLITKWDTTLKNGYDIKLENEDYTIGKVFEYIFHEKYYKNEKKLNFVGFRKNHPHDDHSIIRFGFNEETQEGVIYDMFYDATQYAVSYYESLRQLFAI